MSHRIEVVQIIPDTMAQVRKRDRMPLSTQGRGIQIFKNGVKYFE